MTLSAGEYLGPYEIVSALGAGGMGTVYKARDPRLDRLVAIKVSQAEFSDRFAREARSIAALNHPNICQIYDVGPNYLVMEYVEGAPLTTPESSRKLIDLAVQIADGMAAAHTAGIVHRDLKPDNVMVTRAGRVKILDFGLAKAIAADKEKAKDVTATIAMGMTEPGTTIGTVSYMSPEQARGDISLGPQSDQFAFGLMLYEMAAGKRPFVRDSRAETMTAIIREEAEPLPLSAPAPLRWVIARLLSKDPADRYDSSRDLYRELKQMGERLSDATASASAMAPATTIGVPERAGVSKRSLLPWVMLAGGLAAGGVGVLFLTPKPVIPLADLSKYVFTPLSRDEATEVEPAWSPDGKSIAYVANVHGVWQIFIRALGSSEAAQITHSERGTSTPFWSPDGNNIYFSADGGLWVVGSTGGTPERVLENAASAVIHRDGTTFAFIRERKFWTSARGGQPSEVKLPPDQNSKADVRAVIGFSADGSKLAVLLQGQIWILDYPRGAAKKIDADVRIARWMPDGKRLLTLGMSDLEGKLSILNTADGTQRMIYSYSDTLIDPAVSPDGKRIAYSGGRSEWNLMEISIPSGNVRPMMVAGGVSFFPDWAPSGNHYLFATNRAGKWTIEDTSASEGFSRRVAEGESLFGSPKWSPDGSRFIFVQAAAGKPEKVVLSNVSGGAAMPLDSTSVGETSNAFWSPDGAWVMFQRVIPETGDVQVARIHPGSPGGPEILATYKASEPELSRDILQWSPNGQEIAAQGREGLYIESADFKRERKLASGNFHGPLGFSKDGRQLFALMPNVTGQGAAWRLFSYDVATGAVKQLADVNLPITTSSVRGFSLHPDGTRFAISIAKWPFDIWMLEGFE